MTPTINNNYAATANALISCDAYAIRTYGTFDGYIGHDGLDIIVKNNLEKKLTLTPKIGELGVGALRWMHTWRANPMEF